jgi:hypothetical protein
MPRTWSRWLAELRYRLYGPSFVHLQYEVYLLLSMLLFTMGSMAGLYKSSFGMYAGDYLYLLLVLVVSGRHLAFRIFCTWDPSTHASPGIMGLLSHFAQAHLYAGQTFDRPAPPMQQQLYQHYIQTSTTSCSSNSNSASAGTTSGGGADALSLSSSNTAPVPPPPSAADRMNQVIGGVLETREATSWSQLMPSSLMYAWQLPRQYLWFPLGRLWWWQPTTPPSGHPSSAAAGSRRSHRNDAERDSGGRVRYSMRNSDPSTRVHWLRRTHQLVQHYARHAWIKYAPTLQFAITIVIGSFCAEVIGFHILGRTVLAHVPGVRDWMYARKYTLFRLPLDKNMAIRMEGEYERKNQPSVPMVVGVMLFFGTILCVLVLLRVMPPIPDLVAGGSVSKDVARLWHNRASGGGSGSVKSKKSHRHVENNKWMSRIHQMKDHIVSHVAAMFPLATSETAVWVERQCSIAAENRLQLALTVIFYRMAENIVLVGVIPRTNFICRATGHCQAGPSPWERSRILNPGGFNEAIRSVGIPLFDYMESDLLSSVWTMVGVIVVSGILMSTQTFVLNRAYLSAFAYHNVEWQLMEKKSRKSSTASAQPPNSVSTWDATRTYAKGDVVLYQNRLYRATINRPMSRPYDRLSFGLHDRLVTELGPPETSAFMAALCTYQLVAALIYFNVWIVLLLVGERSSTYGLMWAVAANIVAVHGVLSSMTRAAPVGFSRHGFSQPSKAMLDLRELSAEIAKGN